MNTKLFVSAIAVAAAFAMNGHAANLVSSTDPSTIAKSYGRAGGLADGDRVTGLTAGTGKLGVVYDADVAARTNMQRDQTGGGQVGVGYDADVAARTNMPRGEGAADYPKAAVGEGTKIN